MATVLFPNVSQTTPFGMASKASRMLLFWLFVFVSGQMSAQCSGTVVDIVASPPGQPANGSTWTVPGGGSYKVRITAKGGKGGNHLAGSVGVGGAGAVMAGDFLLLSGQTIGVIAGSEGITGNGNPVFPSGGAYLIVGGGGGSGAGPFNVGASGGPGLTTQNGGNGLTGASLLAGDPCLCGSSSAHHGAA